MTQEAGFRQSEFVSALALCFQSPEKLEIQFVSFTHHPVGYILLEPTQDTKTQSNGGAKYPKEPLLGPLRVSTGEKNCFL